MENHTEGDADSAIQAFVEEDENQIFHRDERHAQRAEEEEEEEAEELHLMGTKEVAIAGHNEHTTTLVVVETEPYLIALA